MKKAMNNDTELTRRGFLRAAGVTATALAFKPNLFAATPYTLGPTQIIYQDSPFFLDLPVTTISDGKGGFYFFHCRGACSQS